MIKVAGSYITYMRLNYGVYRDMKKPLTIKEQVEHLKSDKKIVFNNVSEVDAKSELLTKNYINIITPFKEKFSNGYDENGKHLYEEEIEFGEYLKCYDEERKKYSDILRNILEIETTFNSVLTHYIFIDYKEAKVDEIYSNADFELYIENVLSENMRRIDDRQKQKYLDMIEHIKGDIAKYKSPYIALDRLSLKQTLNLYNVISAEVRRKTFHILQEKEYVLNTVNPTQFEKKLFKVVHIRNCIAHNNSLTILINYYNVAEKQKRWNDGENGKQYFKGLIEELQGQ